MDKDTPFSVGETASRRDAVLRRMIATPPTPHKKQTDTKAGRATGGKVVPPKTDKRKDRS